MRLLLEIVVVAALIAFGWEKSFHDRLSGAPVADRKPTAPAPSQSPPPRIVAQPTPALSNGSWMWEKHGTLDAPKKHGQRPPH